MKNLILSLLVLTAACSNWPPPKFAENASVAAVTGVSYRVIARCELGSEHANMIIGGGSAVAVAPRHALTARHVIEGSRFRAEAICGGPDMYKLVVRSPEGAELEVVPDAYPGDPNWQEHTGADAARLVLAGVAEFPRWAPLARTLPRIGDQVCSFTGSQVDHEVGELFSYKCGYVSRVAKDYLVLGLKGAPGNSGAGLLNSRGELVGLITEGYMDPRSEFIMLGPSIVALRELVTDSLFPA